MNADKRHFRVIALLGAMLLGVAIVYVAFQQRWAGAVVLSVFLAMAIVVIVRRSRLPTLFEALFVIAALVNAAGYTWNFFETLSWYDETAHLLTGFAVTLALGFLLYEELMEGFRAHRVMFVVTITGLGIALGTTWEVAEWLVEIVFEHDMLGDIRDTMTDLVLDAAGAFAAALLNLNGLNEE